MEFVGWLIAFVVGGVVGWLLGRGRASSEAGRLGALCEERDRRAQELQQQLACRESELAELRNRCATAETRLEEQRRQTEEKLALLDEARLKLEETFRSAASQSLRENSEAFLQLARVQIGALVAQAGGDLDKRRETMEKLIGPMAETLSRYEESLRRVETARAEAYAGLSQQIVTLGQSEQTLQAQTQQLANALKSSPGMRGNWGEVTLRRVVELAGMTKHVDFSEQVSVGSDETRGRPDMVIHLPGGRNIVVDAKAALSAYLEATEAPGPEQAQAKLVQHAKHVRRHAEELASREYTRQFENAPEFTVLFLPGECFFSAAVGADPELLQDALRERVIVTSPTTLIALLLVVAQGWSEAQMEENARRICEVGRDLSERLGKVLEHFDGITKALKHAVEEHDKVVGSIQQRLMPQVRKLRELTSTAESGQAEPATLQMAPRQIAPPSEAP